MQLRRANQTKTAEASHQRSRSVSITPLFTRAPVHPILQLQHTLGNQAVQRLLRSGAIQAKLSISQPDDIYEQEADRVAEQVIRMPVPMLQRACAPCVAGGAPCPKCEDEKIGLVQRNIGQPSSATGSSVPNNFLQNLGPGRPLDPATRDFFEPRFGHDFGRVRVHTDAKAAESARAVNAQAYTVGRNVVFDGGAYSPSTSRGRWLLAHELTHVVQQSRMTDKATQRKLIQRTTVGNVLDEFFSPFSDETLWVMPENDKYTRIVRTWQPVINAVSQAKANLQANCANWNANHMTDPSWTPGMTSPPVADPNAHNIDVASPPGTDPDTCRNAFIIYVGTAGQTFELYTCSVGSFDIYATVNSIDCAAQTAQMNIWMYNRMSRTSFGRFASNPLLALSGMESQYMWWNWTESVSWGSAPATPSGGSGGSGGWNPSPSARGVGACFTGRMGVTMADGRVVPIPQVAVGDQVVAYDNVAQCLRTCKVVTCHKHPAGEYLKVWLEGGRLLEVTWNHELYVGDRWVQAEALRVGDHLCLMENGDTGLTPVAVDRIEPGADQLPLFDLTVADCHTYFVSGLLVHNKNA